MFKLAFLLMVLGCITNEMKPNVIDANGQSCLHIDEMKAEERITHSTDKDTWRLTTERQR